MSIINMLDEIAVEEDSKDDAVSRWFTPAEVQELARAAGVDEDDVRDHVSRCRTDGICNLQQALRALRAGDRSWARIELRRYRDRG